MTCLHWQCILVLTCIVILIVAAKLIYWQNICDAILWYTLWINPNILIVGVCSIECELKPRNVKKTTTKKKKKHMHTQKNFDTKNKWIF